MLCILFDLKTNSKQITKHIKATGKTKEYPYYHCTCRRGNCSQNKYIIEDKLEQLIKDEISKFTILPQFRDWALEVLRESHKDETKERKEIFVFISKFSTPIPLGGSVLFDCWVCTPS